MLASISSSLILDNNTWVNYIETLGDVQKCMEMFRFSSPFKARILQYYICQHQFNHGSRLHDVAEMCPKHLMAQIREESFYKLIKQQDVFRGMSEEFLKKICSVCYRIVLPRHEVVIYSGSRAKHFYILYEGYCELIPSSKDLKPRLLAEGDNCGVTETFLDMPYVHTCVATTTVILIELAYVDVMSVFTQFPEELAELQMVIKEVRQLINEEYEMHPSEWYVH